MGSIVVISIMILASAGILIGGFLLFRNVFDRIDEKWHDRWQYYKVIGVKSLRKAVTVALCIVSITFALIAGMCIPLDINVVSWWICVSTAGMTVSLKMDLRFPIPGQAGHGSWDYSRECDTFSVK